MCVMAAGVLILFTLATFQWQVEGFLSLSPAQRTTRRHTALIVNPGARSLKRRWQPSRLFHLYALMEQEQQEKHPLSSSANGDSHKAPNGSTTTTSISTTTTTSTTSSSPLGFRSKMHDLWTLPQTAYRIYTSYFDELWTATNTSARTKIANDKVRTAVRRVQNILQNTDEYEPISSGGVLEEDVETRQAKQNLLKACDYMLAALNVQDAKLEVESGSSNTKVINKTTSSPVETAADEAVSTSHTTSINSSELSSSSTTESAAVVVAQSRLDTATTTTTATATATTTPPKKQRSVLFGAAMGAVVACWVFSGNYIFTGLFCLMTILGQLEYYRMVMNTGVFPARRISVIGATSMFVTALFAPDFHQICLPMFGLWAMIWKLTMRRQIATIPEIATTFTGMFYLGYVPSFWVRTRLIGANAMPTRLYPWTSSFRDFLQAKFGFLVPQSYVIYPITTGAVFIFWSWLSLAFSDVGAYFVGRKYGKTKLSTISPAAGATSPNKSVEGVVGGCIASAILSIWGAWVQKWPYFIVTGAIHGTILAILGLIGDLTASMLKRDAGLKDFGNIIPEHGGILDRVDSFVWTAPYSWVVCAYVIPALRKFAGQV